MKNFFFPFSNKNNLFLENKIWHRLIKFIFFMVIFIGIGITLTTNQTNTYKESETTYYYNCTSDELNTLNINKIMQSLGLIKASSTEFPRFTDKQVKQLYKDTADVPQEKKQEIQKQMYKEILIKLKERDKKDQRNARKNYLYKTILEENNIEEQNKKISLLKKINFADIIRNAAEKAGTPVNIDDDNTLITKFNELNIGNEHLLNDYTNGKISHEELLNFFDLDYEISKQQVKEGLIGEASWEFQLTGSSYCNRIVYSEGISYIKNTLIGLGIIYLISLLLQLIYYKGVIYIIYGNNYHGKK